MQGTLLSSDNPLAFNVRKLMVAMHNLEQKKKMEEKTEEKKKKNGKLAIVSS